MTIIRALWMVRRTLRRYPGGDTVQILQTAAALRERGVQVEMTSNPRPQLSGVDLVHLFHLDRVWENVPQAVRAKRAGVPVALSTIWWPMDEFDRQGRAGMQGFLARMAGFRMYQNVRLLQRSCARSMTSIAEGRLTRPRWSFSGSVQRLLNQVDMLLPNSRAEADALVERFGNRAPFLVVPNGVDTRMIGSGIGGLMGGGVLCVGRIEPRKNQLMLIRALRGTGIRLTLVGGAGRFSRGYLRACRREADELVRFTGPLTPREVYRQYSRHGVHCAPSWYETPGLASIEAAVRGLPVVVTRGGCTEEYFGNEAQYCLPADPDSIRQAIERAMRAEPSEKLVMRIREKFTWEAAAERTEEAYRRILSGKG